MNEHDFRTLALALTGASEGAHMGHPDFRINNRIFATLHGDGEFAMVKLTPDQQHAFMDAYPDVFMPESGAWGRAGSTRVRLASAEEDVLGEALTLAWQDAVNAPSRRPTAKKSSAARRSGKPRR